jgi:lysophospholipase L1-like esterase
MKSLPFLLLAVLLCPLVRGAESPVEPSERPYKSWQDRQKLLNERVAQAGAQAQVIFIGDSLVAGWEEEGKEVWNRYYAPRHALNLGIVADETQHVLWRLTHGNLDGLAPRVVVLMFGGNNRETTNNTEEQMVEGIAAILAVLRAKLPSAKIFLHPIFPFGRKLDELHGHLAWSSWQLSRYADGKHVFWIDFNQRFMTGRAFLIRDQWDYCHLTEAGFRIWAEEIETQLASELGGVPVAKTQP